jgi:eukaryotic-like serine/threonine-protein kinase
MKNTSFFDFLKSKYLWRQLLWGATFITVLCLVFLKSLDLITLHGNEVSVPKVVGMSVKDALQTLQEMNFRVSLDSEFVEEKPKGSILEQFPNYGDKVKDHRTIYLTMVKYSAPLVKLPIFEDLPYKEYESILKGMGIEVDGVIYKADIARDLVLGVQLQGKEIKEGYSISKGSKVNLLLGDGLGGNLVELPNLLGLKLDEARFSIRGSQLILGNVTYVGSISDSSSLKVVRQIPEYKENVKTKISQGSLIELELGP